MFRIFKNKYWMIKLKIIKQIKKIQLFKKREKEEEKKQKEKIQIQQIQNNLKIKILFYNQT